MLQRSTRQLITKLAALGSGMGAVGYAYGLYESRNPVVEHVTVPIPNLPAHLNGFKIAQLSDFHIDVTSKTVVKRAVEIVNNSGAEVVLLTGDFVDHNPTAIFALTPLLKKLTAKYGMYAGLGNHDFHNPHPWYGQIVRYGFGYFDIPLLVNESVVLPNGLVIAGIDDPLRGTPDLDATLADIPADSPIVLICHRPDFADLYAQDGRIALQLSGHTHGGQVRVPGIGAIILPSYGKKYVNGLYKVGGMWLYVNRGLGGTDILSIRFNCPPEVTILTLTTA